ncbi:MAG: penicillin-binding protein 2 [bacterium]|nr:penicillin-binding protein 2 [bacterium]
MAFRITVIFAGFGIGYAALLFNIFNLQLEKGSYYAARAESQYRAAGGLAPPRGNIFITDKNGTKIPVAINRDYPLIFAVPKEIEDAAEAAEKLAGIIGKTPADLTALLAKLNDPYESLTKRATSEQIDAVRALDLAGVYVDAESGRFYPLGSLVSHLVGFSNFDDKEERVVGRYGVELFYNGQLAGNPGQATGDKVIPYTTGEDVLLTIDRNIQSRADEILRALIKERNAIGGSFIVQEPKTGKILAMGGVPNFDSNEYGKSELGVFLNPTIQGVYEPGSVFKLFTMAAGIESGAITPETTYYDSGSVTLNGRTIRNWDLKAHGKQTMTNVIEQSLNTGAIFAMRETGYEQFYRYLVAFGFAEPTGIGLPGELKGNLTNIKNGRDINYATASFGQGISVTALELVNAVSAIANSGMRMRPYILARESPREASRVISEDTARKVTQMMVSAVEKNLIARIPRYTVAGKTGSAFIPDFKRGGYTDDVINTYVGFAPAHDPQFTILVRLDHPAGAPLAGLTVVPAFRELAEFILNYYTIPPDKP